MMSKQVGTLSLHTGSPKISEFSHGILRDNQAGMSSIKSEMEQIDLGVNWWPHKNVVVKVDYQIQDAEKATGTELDGMNIGIGYSF